MPGGSRKNASKDSDVVILPWEGVQGCNIIHCLLTEMKHPNICSSP